MSDQHLRACSLPEWYPLLRSVTFPTRIIPLPLDFVEYLKADGIFMPLDSNCEEIGKIYTRDHDSDYDNDDIEEEEVVTNAAISCEAEEETSEDSNQARPCFPELVQAIEDAIRDLDGEVFPKLDWSAPLDASWISYNGTLKCHSATDICLLLKSSDFIMHDLLNAPNNHSFHLVLRKWITFHPAMEFRCFVVQGRLYAISQRDQSNFYAFLLQHRQEIVEKIQSFWRKHLLSFSEASYVFDVYLTRNDSSGEWIRKVWLVDLNPFESSTDALLFEWEELKLVDGAERDAAILLRLVESEHDARISTRPKFSSNMLPMEAVLLSQNKSLLDLVVDGR